MITGYFSTFRDDINLTIERKSADFMWKWCFTIVRFSRRGMAEECQLSFDVSFDIQNVENSRDGFVVFAKDFP